MITGMLFWMIAFPILLIILVAPSCPQRTPTYYFNEGEKLTALGESFKAIMYYTKAIKDKPGYIEAYVSRASAWMKEDSIDRAIQDYSKVIELRPSGEAYYLRGAAYWSSASNRDSLACKDWLKAKETYNHNRSWEKVRLYCK